VKNAGHILNKKKNLNRNLLTKQHLIRFAQKNRSLYLFSLSLYEKYERLLKLKGGFRREIHETDIKRYFDFSQQRNLNVIVLVIDCLRNSNLSSRNKLRRTTPFLDSFESKFNAISASSWTYPAVPSILTGLYPHNHGAVLAGRVKDQGKPETYRKLRDHVLTLPEILNAFGYRIYFGTDVALASYPFKGRIVPKRYDIFVGLAEWIAKYKNDRLFAYVHIGDLHEPLNPPPGFRSYFGEVKRIENISAWDFITAEQCRNTPERFIEFKENRQMLYDNTLRFVDYKIECFYESLKRLGLDDNTILLVTADHGEEFWEHAVVEENYFYNQRGSYGIGHGHSIFNETIKVPLLLSGGVPHSESEELVSTVDIVPTIFYLLSVGHSLRLDGENIYDFNNDRALLCEASATGYERKALIFKQYKLMYSPDDNVEWLFDLKNDCDEQRPIKDRSVTSIYVEKLLNIMREDEKRNVRQIKIRKNIAQLNL